MVNAAPPQPGHWVLLVLQCIMVILGVIAMMVYVSGPASGAPPVSASNINHAVTPSNLWRYREAAREMFYHAFDNYMEHAFPWDELKPLTCEGRRWDQPERGTLDDILGG